jgi:hypothetical protein
MIEQGGLGQVAHGAAVFLGQELENAPVLDWHAFVAKFLIELQVNLAVGLRQKIGDVLADRPAACHGLSFLSRIRFHGQRVPASIFSDR